MEGPCASLSLPPESRPSFSRPALPALPPAPAFPAPSAPPGTPKPGPPTSPSPRSPLSRLRQGQHLPVRWGSVPTASPEKSPWPLPAAGRRQPKAKAAPAQSRGERSQPRHQRDSTRVPVPVLTGHEGPWSRERTGGPQARQGAAPGRRRWAAGSGRALSRPLLSQETPCVSLPAAPIPMNPRACREADEEMKAGEGEGAPWEGEGQRWRSRSPGFGRQARVSPLPGEPDTGRCSRILRRLRGAGV